MTNKTEISLQDLIARCTDYDDMTLEMDSSDRGMLLRHISRFEAAEARIAEQQQQYDLIINSYANRAEKADTELAALRTAAGPVGEVMHLRDGRDGPREPEIACLAGSWSEYPDGTMLFTHPAPVVVLPKLHLGVVQKGKAVMIPYKGGHWLNKTAVIEMLSGAGITVKSADGEGQVHDK